MFSYTKVGTLNIIHLFFIVFCKKGMYKYSQPTRVHPSNPTLFIWAKTWASPCIIATHWIAFCGPADKLQLNWELYRRTVLECCYRLMSLRFRDESVIFAFLKQHLVSQSDRRQLVHVYCLKWRPCMLWQAVSKNIILHLLKLRVHFSGGALLTFFKWCTLLY